VNLPYWLQLLQGLAVPAIALLAATIGLLQWYTAHRRAMLDLFDRRMEVYSDIRSVIDQITASGKCTYEANFDYLRVIDRATFLFGRDVNAYLERLRVRLHNLCYYESMMETGQRQEMISKKDVLLPKVLNFYTEFPPLIEPYVRMGQRRASLRRRFRN
jgi:hypothetical protein